MIEIISELGIRAIFFFLQTRAVMLPKCKILRLKAMSWLHSEYLGRREKVVLNPDELIACGTQTFSHDGRDIWELCLLDPLQP